MEILTVATIQFLFQVLNFTKAVSNVSLNGGEGSDTISVDDVTLGDENDGRYTQSYLTVTGGAGNATLTDISTSDIISLSGDYSQAYYKSDKNIFIYDTGVKVALGGVSDVSSISSVKIYNGSQQKTFGNFVTVLEWKLENGVASYGDLITISGLSTVASWSDLTVDGKAINTLDDEEIKASGKPVVISNNALDTEKVVEITDGFTLELGNDVTDTPQDIPEHWEISEGVAAYFATGLTAGYVLSDNTIFYQSEQKGDVVTEVDGLSAEATLDDISMSGKVVTIKNHGLDVAKTVTITRGYTLALGSDVIDPVVVAPVWKVENGTANYMVGGTTSGFVTDDTQITYQPADDGESQIEISGLSSSVTVDDIFWKNTVVTISNNTLDTSKTVSITNGYTLALGSDVTDIPQVVSPTWRVSNGTATYQGGKTAGYTVSGNTITYSAAVDDETLATITGLKADATASGISLSGNVITLKESVFDRKEVTLTGDGYTLALADDVAKPTPLTASWKVSEGTASYRGSTTAGYVVENNKIVYKEASDDEPIMTITGL